jgi:hypothetical protein
MVLPSPKTGAKSCAHEEAEISMMLVSALTRVELSEASEPFVNTSYCADRCGAETK